MECVRLPDDAARLDSGFWVVVMDFEGTGRAWRFADVVRGERADASSTPADMDWDGPTGEWRSSITADQYREGVAAVRARIRAGDVYQVNLCRVLETALPGRHGREPSAAALGARLAAGNPAPFAGGVHVPVGGALAPIWLGSASPERFLTVARYAHAGPPGPRKTPLPTAPP